MNKAKDKRLHILSSNACNNDCLFCMEDKVGGKQLKNELTNDFIFKILKDNKKKYDQVLFTGNEPTLNKNLINYVLLAKKLGFKQIQLISNGRILADNKILMKLVMAGVNVFIVSVHYFEKNIHNQITRREGSFAQTVKALDNLKKYHDKYKLQIITNTTLISLNYLGVKTILDFLSQYPLKTAVFNLTIPIGEALKNQKINIKYSEVVNLFKKIDFKKYNFEVVINGAVPCLLPKNLELLGYKEIVYSETDERKLIKSDSNKLKRPACRQCKFFTICDGVWQNYIELFGWDEFKPVLK